MSDNFYNEYNSNMQSAYQKQVNELKQQQQAEALRLQAQADNQVRQYEAQKPVLKQRFTDSAQDAYVQKMQSLKEMPQVLAAQGYNGGLSESSNIKVDNVYGNAYNGHQKDYNTGLREVDNQISNTRASLSDMLAQSSNQYNGLITSAQSGYQQMLAQAAKEQQAYKLQEQVRQQEFAYKQQQDKLANDLANRKYQASLAPKEAATLTLSQAENAFKSGNTSKNVISTLTNAYGDDYVSGEVSKVRSTKVNDWLSTPQMKLTISRATKDQTPQFMENAIMNAVMRGELSVEEAEIASKRLGLEVR